ncbi:hypothetical protein [Pseudomonas sp. GM80]|uniref:hypothetical protein n=1 Tax=Pseudomonas sp. GM80 TaxID=1144339 RepID=UPI00026F8305|nr:hypothetical protein [Pseudomonas sp. GM80]EJN34857.1 hypothetical protein PMI37_00900 [Pseudomonas sp. GM80]
MDSKSRFQSVNNAVSVTYLLVEVEPFQGYENAQARVFANGVQKCVALITLQARNSNGEIVSLADDLNVNIVPYTSASGSWNSDRNPPVTGVLPFPEQTIASTNSQSLSRMAVEHPDNTQQFRRYISYTGVPDGTVNQFAAQVQLPGTKYISNHRDAPYGGAGQNGRFNSSFRLKALAPPVYASYNGGLLLSDPVEVFSGPLEGYTAKVHNRYLSLRLPGTSTPVNIHPQSSTPADSSLHDNKATAFGDPGSAIAKKNVPAGNQLGLSMNQALAAIRQPRSGAIAIAVGMYSRVSELFPVRQACYYSSGMDVYGNPLRFAATLASEYPLRDPWLYQLSVEWAGAASPQQEKPPLSSWLTQLAVVVSSASNRVYPNSRQQLEVTVGIESLMSQTVKPEELASVKLMVRDAFGQFTALPEGDAGDGAWFFRRERNEYLEYPGVVSEPSSVPPAAVHTRTFFVSASKSGNSGGNLERLYVGITRHTSEGSFEYITDGEESGFVSNVEVRKAEIPEYLVDNYTFERTLISGNGDSDTFVWQYALAGGGVQQPLVKFLSASMTPVGVIQWDDRSSNVTRASNVGFSSPGGTIFQYNPAIQLGSAFTPVTQVSNPKNGHVMLVLQGANNIPYHSQSAINHNGPCVLNAVDVYGNDHRLQIRFKDASPLGRHELVLF